MFRRGVVFFILMLSVQIVWASVADTVIALDPVVAKGVKFERYVLGSKIIPLDTFQLSLNSLAPLSEMLSFQSIANITSNGPGGQAGIKIRGGQSDHTTVIWNGLNLKPPMSGDLNYSAITSGVIDEIRIQPGGSSTMYGSGASTGIIYLTNNIDLSKKGLMLDAVSEVGSFGYYGLNGKIGFVTDKFATKLIVAHQNSDNNFKYKYGGDIFQEEHADYNTFSVMQQNFIKLGSRTKIETDFWYSSHFKKIPSLKSNTTPGKTEQTDENIRIALNLNHFGNKYYVKFRSGFLDYINDYLGYDITLSEFYKALNLSRSFINEIETKYRFSTFHAIYLGVNHTYDKVNSDSYKGHDANRHQFDLFSRYALDLLNGNLQFNFEGRQAITDGELQPFVYSIGANYSLSKEINFKSLFSKLYTLPDLNDLYWSESGGAYGNPNLLPEYGYSGELGVSHHKDFKGLSISHEITGYYSELIDAIVWEPDSDNRYIPINHKQSSTYGIEFIGKSIIKIESTSLLIGYDYCYTHAMVKVERFTGNEWVQRRYIPKHKVGLKLQSNIKNFSWGIYNQYVGERNKDEGVTFPLDDYLLMDIYVNYGLKIMGAKAKLFAKIKNVLNADYQILSGYAQPLRNYTIGFNYNF